jgi:hypothetical protein
MGTLVLVLVLVLLMEAAVMLQLLDFRTRDCRT